MTRQLGKDLLDLFSNEPKMDEEQTVDDAPFAAPPPPVAKRLNRNALTVAAIIMGMTVIACLVVLRGEAHEKPGRPSTQPSDEVAVPTFLERPARPQSPAIFNDDSLRPPSRVAFGSQLSPRRGNAPVTPSEFHDAPVASLEPAITGEVRTPRPRDQAFTAALRHSAVAGSPAESATEQAPGPSVGSSPGLASEESQLVAYGDSLMRTATRPASSVAPTTLGGARQAFMVRAGDQAGRSTIATLQPSSGPYVLRAGTVIPAMLLTAITSDLPGDCMGQVSRDIYDSQEQRLILIPKGSKLMCRYDDQVAAGQGRLLIAWTRLILPDGRSMTLPGLALKDGQGQTGAKGDVDNHTARVFGRALLLSAIGAGAQLSQPRQASILAAPSAGQVAAGAVGQEMSNVALEVLRRGMDQPPTITLPQGATFNVFLNGDIIFDGPRNGSR
jgi:type IV secretory pathway VirB10-like protein